MITLRENIQRAKNLVNAIDSLTNPNLYGNRQTDYINERNLRRTMKNLKRLTVVIEKQIREGSRSKFKETRSETRSRQLNSIFK